MKPWFVYIARARTNRLYTGITTDPGTRLKKHNSGNGARLAVTQGPFVLVYISPPFKDKSTARNRELQIKGWTRQKKLKLINGQWV